MVAVLGGTFLLCADYAQLIIYNYRCTLVNTKHQHLKVEAMTTEEAKKYYGGIKELAKALAIWPHNISRWGEYPPMKRQYEIEVKTGGKLRAEKHDK